MNFNLQLRHGERKRNLALLACPDSLVLEVMNAITQGIGLL